MSFYKAGETKVRPGVYKRYEKTGTGNVPGAVYGVFAIPIHADFGPVGVVTNFATDQVDELKALYGTGGTVDAALALFDGGATKVYAYRLGTGGTPATVEITSANSNIIATVSTKYPTDKSFNITIKPKLDDDKVKQILVYLGTELKETINYVKSDNEKEAFVIAMNTSAYLKAVAGEGTGEVEAVTNKALTGGTAPTVTVESYSTAFDAFESFKWNMLVLDTVETEVHSLAHAYIKRIFEDGALGVCTIGEPVTVDFQTRCSHASAFNDEKVIYLGSGFEDVNGKKVDGYLAIAKQAGIIGSLASNTSATHTVVSGAVNVLETLKKSQYEAAINNGMLLLSVNEAGQVWFDSGINTLVTPNENQDDGWKKIRRTATRFEMFDRITRAVAPLVGKIDCDDIGIGDVVIQGQSVLDAMIAESKLHTGATFAEDTDLERGPDYAYFVIVADDLDSLEKIYLRYQFRFAAETTAE